MTGKKISFGAKPSSTANPDAWVERRISEVEAKPMKRLTLDISEDLHREIKAQCAMRGVKIAEELRELLLQKYTKQ